MLIALNRKVGSQFFSEYKLIIPKAYAQQSFFRRWEFQKSTKLYKFNNFFEETSDYNQIWMRADHANKSSYSDFIEIPPERLFFLRFQKL